MLRTCDFGITEARDAIFILLPFPRLIPRAIHLG